MCLKHTLHECQVKYQESTNNSDILTKCLINNDIKMGGKLWLKCMKNVIYENFRKIRINGKSPKDKQIQELYEKRSQAEQGSLEVTEIDCLLSERIFERNRALIVEQINEMSDSSSNLSRVKMWKIKQKVCPKNEVTPPVAKIDQQGNLIYIIIKMS